jgi:hypothetical protein
VKYSPPPLQRRPPPFLLFLFCFLQQHLGSDHLQPADCAQCSVLALPWLPRDAFNVVTSHKVVRASFAATFLAFSVCHQFHSKGRRNGSADKLQLRLWGISWLSGICGDWCASITFPSCGSSMRCVYLVPHFDFHWDKPELCMHRYKVFFAFFTLKSSYLSPMYVLSSFLWAGMAANNIICDHGLACGESYSRNFGLVIRRRSTALTHDMHLQEWKKSENRS